MPENLQASCREKKKEQQKEAGEGRGEEGEGGKGMRVSSRADLEMGRRVGEFLICCGREVFLLSTQGEFL